uniref:Uncharacterized protein n=1 Tax=Mesocestoides corti TaxID=53468 RepID=A0A5K3G4L1_MESCO
MHSIVTKLAPSGLHGWMKTLQHVFYLQCARAIPQGLEPHKGRRQAAEVVFEGRDNAGPAHQKGTQNETAIKQQLQVEQMPGVGPGTPVCILSTSLLLLIPLFRFLFYYCSL